MPAEDTHSARALITPFTWSVANIWLANEFQFDLTELLIRSVTRVITRTVMYEILRSKL